MDPKLTSGLFLVHVQFSLELNSDQLSSSSTISFTETGYLKSLGGGLFSGTGNPQDSFLV